MIVCGDVAVAAFLKGKHHLGVSTFAFLEFTSG